MNRGLTYIYDAPHIFIPWVTKNLGFMPGDFDDAKAIGVLDKNKKTIASVLYHNYRIMKHGSSMEMTIYSTTPLFATNKTIAVFLNHPLQIPFIKRIWCQTSINNMKSQRFLKKVGFYNEGRHLNGWNGEDDSLSFVIPIKKAEEWIQYL